LRSASEKVLQVFGDFIVAKLPQKRGEVKIVAQKEIIVQKEIM